MPIPSVQSSIACLDRKRLWKQVLEAREIIQILKDKKDSRWWHHPAVLMWKGYEDCLIYYFNTALQRCLDLGFNTKIEFIKRSNIIDCFDSSFVYPFWFGYEKFHKSHRIALLTKLYEHYKEFGWKEQSNPDYEYFWPVSKCVHCYGTGFF